MRKFFAGLSIGLALSTATTAMAAKMVGDNGYLWGFTVTLDGEEICSDPYIWTGYGEIECG